VQGQGIAQGERRLHSLKLLQKSSDASCMTQKHIQHTMTHAEPRANDKLQRLDMDCMALKAMPTRCGDSNKGSSSSGSDGSSSSSRMRFQTIRDELGSLYGQNVAYRTAQHIKIAVNPSSRCSKRLSRYKQRLYCTASKHAPMDGTLSSSSTVRISKLDKSLAKVALPKVRARVGWLRWSWHFH